MSNKDFILKITDKHKTRRIEKIVSFIKRDYVIQNAMSSEEFPTAYGITNIIIPAKKQQGKIAVIAHHDVFPNSFGYNDNSSGVVTLLKLQDYCPDNVELVFTDGEERGGQGSRYYLEHYPRPAEAINVDVVGLEGRIFYEAYGKARRFGIPKDFEYYHNIPFSDSYILENYDIPNILILTGKSKETLIRDIFNAQHNGCNDGKIDFISEKMMDHVFQRLVEILGG